MRRRSMLPVIKKLGKQVFTTHELSLASGRSLSVVTQSLNNLVREGAVIKVRRGVWAEEGLGAISPYAVIPYLFPAHRAYVSFISALHIHGVIEQIPQVTTLASTAHAGIIKTSIGTFYVHHIMPSFFCGFGWYKGNGSFLIAEPEKALIDSLYLSAYKRKRFGRFPELHFPKTFSFKRVKEWMNKIPSKTTREYVRRRLKDIRVVAA
ncbi:MAG: hypothetical protein Q8O01_07110 [Candidatus Omnitrophota bacterium]|nr:hypothetical protein [Candidatus Omnitrophota bacterium]